MNTRLRAHAIDWLRWTLGVIVLLQSCRTLFVYAQLHAPPKTGVPHAIVTALASSEIVAAVLFLIPVTSALGGYLLLAVFALAAIVHILHGQWDVGVLAIYSMAVLVCMAHRANGTLGVADDGR